MFKQNLLYHNIQIFCIKQVDQASDVVAFGFKKGFVYNINIVYTGLHNKMCIIYICKQFVSYKKKIESLIYKLYFIICRAS